MSVYKIADLLVSIPCKSEYTKNLMSDYLYNGTDFDFEIKITDSDIKNEQITVDGYSYGMYESTAILRKLSYELLMNYNGIMLHCAVIAYKGKAYAFAAPSGTGKTTHIKIWKKCLGNSIEIINGDKPFIRYINNVPTAFGTPWQGKENFGKNISYPLDAVFILKRGRENTARKVKADAAIFTLMNSAACPKNQIGKLKALEFLEKLRHDIKLIELSCNMEDSACYTALSAIEGD